jgi:hypothetical protein
MIHSTHTFTYGIKEKEKEKINALGRDLRRPIG